MRTDSDTVKGVFMDDANSSSDRNAKKFLAEKALLASILKHFMATIEANFKEWDYETLCLSHKRAKY